MDLSDFEPWLTRWHLEVDGAPFASRWSQLLPVRREGHAMMLKAHMAEQEVQGSAFLATYGGRGAVHVYERDADAVLMERATGPRDLINIALEAGELAAFQHTGFWQPMDTLRDKNHLEEPWACGSAPWKVWT